MELTNDGTLLMNCDEFLRKANFIELVRVIGTILRTKYSHYIHRVTHPTMEDCSTLNNCTMNATGGDGYIAAFDEMSKVPQRRNGITVDK